jgi:hypothetical protein
VRTQLAARDDHIRALEALCKPHAQGQGQAVEGEHAELGDEGGEGQRLLSPGLKGEAEHSNGAGAWGREGEEAAQACIDLQAVDVRGEGVCVREGVCGRDRLQITATEDDRQLLGLDRDGGMGVGVGAWGGGKGGGSEEAIGQVEGLITSALVAMEDLIEALSTADPLRAGKLDAKLTQLEGELSTQPPQVSGILGPGPAPRIPNPEFPDPKHEHLSPDAGGFMVGDESSYVVGADGVGEAGQTLNPKP